MVRQNFLYGNNISISVTEVLLGILGLVDLPSHLKIISCVKHLKDIFDFIYSLCGLMARWCSTESR